MSGDESMPDAEVDRHFAELVAHFYDEAADRSEPACASRPPEPTPRDQDLPAWLTDLDLEPFVPEPPPPLPRLSLPALAGTLLITVAVLVCLLAVLGLPFPAWAGWLAITGFAVGMALLLSRLPRHRDPDDGDGAVL